MEIVAILEKSEGLRFSLEVYPPKTTRSPGGPSVQEHISRIFDTVERLLRYGPAFVSVTYNPEGQTKSTSIPVASIIRQRFGVEAVAHLTSLGTPISEVPRTLDVMDYFGVHNVLAIRGDPPEARAGGAPPSCVGRGGAGASAARVPHAAELVAIIKRHRRDFCVGVACYPEGHPECLDASGRRDLERDLDHFQEKVRSGASFAITQLFLDNSHFFSFVERARRRGVAVPIIPGIMPVVSLQSLRIVRGLCGAEIPAPLLQRIEGAGGSPDEIKERGIEHALDQCRGLADKVPCIHFYAMNQWEPVERIIRELI